MNSLWLSVCPEICRGNNTRCQSCLRTLLSVKSWQARSLNALVFSVVISKVRVSKSYERTSDRLQAYQVLEVSSMRGVEYIEPRVHQAAKQIGRKADNKHHRSENDRDVDAFVRRSVVCAFWPCQPDDTADDPHVTDTRDHQGQYLDNRYENNSVCSFAGYIEGKIFANWAIFVCHFPSYTLWQPGNSYTIQDPYSD